MNLTNIYISHKSETCLSKNGTPLTEYRNYKEAQESADYQTNRGNISFTPYQCNNCGKYHIKPTEYYCQKVVSRCYCKDHNGKTKDAYATFQDAEKMVKIRKEAGVNLYVYKCPEGNCYHLTSNRIY